MNDPVRRAADVKFDESIAGTTFFVFLEGRKNETRSWMKMEREEKRRKRNREQISGTVREPFRKSRVGNECECMCECSQEEKKRTKCAKRATESRGIIKIGEGNVEERSAAWRKRSRLRTL